MSSQKTKPRSKLVIFPLTMILLGLVVFSSIPNNQLTVQIVRANPDYYFLSQDVSGYANIKPAIYGAQRYLVHSDGAGAIQDNITVQEATAAWALDTDHWHNQNKTGEFYVRTYPTQEPNLLLIYGTYNGYYGFITYFAINTSTFGAVKSVTEDYITDIVYVDPYFYITVVNVPVATYLYKSTKNNLFTPANWVKVDLPYWGGGSYEEPRIAYFNGYMYILRSNTDYYYNLLKWDLSTTFTTLLSSTDANVEPYFIFPFVRSSSTMVCVVVPERTPTKHFHVKYSTDGTNFVDIVTLDFVSQADNSELQCWAFPMSTDDVFVSHTKDTAGTAGYTRVYEIDGTLLSELANVVTHYTEAFLVEDGASKWVAGGEGLTVNPNAVLKLVEYGEPYKTATTCIDLVTVSIDDVYYDFNNTDEVITSNVGSNLQGFLVDVFLDKSYAVDEDEVADVTRIYFTLYDPLSIEIYAGYVYGLAETVSDEGTYWKQTFVIGIDETLTAGTWTWEATYEIQL